MSLKLQSASFRKDRKRGNRPIPPTLNMMLGRTAVYIQDGHVFKTNGEAFAHANIPDWVKKQLIAMDKDTLAVYGFRLQSGRLLSIPRKEVEKGPARPDSPEVNEDEDDDEETNDD